MGSKKEANHWEFLEDIEAPMWVDLAVETKRIDKEIDDEWFHVSHQFHQCSSRQLKAAFSQLEITGSSDFDLGEFASPKLPSSVTKSRGKSYVSRKWKGDSYTSVSSEQHPVDILRGKISGQNQKFASVNEKGISSLTSDLDCENAVGTIVVTHSSDSASCSTSLTKSSGIIGFQQDVSNQLVGRKSGLLSVLRLSLRRSHATRPALRVEIIDSRQRDERKSSSYKSSLGSSSNHSAEVTNPSKVGEIGGTKPRGRKSSSSKSSVGSSRVEIIDSRQRDERKSSSYKSSLGSSSNHSAEVTNPSKVGEIGGTKPRGRKSSSSKSSVGSSSIQSYSLRNTITERRSREKTPDSGNVSRLSKPADNKEKLNLQKASKSRMGNNASGHCKGNKAIITKSALPVAAKSKGTILRKALVPLKVNEQGSLSAASKAKGKVHVIPTNRPKVCGKENTTMSWKPGGKAIVTGGMLVNHKVKPTEEQKCGRSVLNSVKGRTSIYDEQKKIKETRLYHR